MPAHLAAALPQHDDEIAWQPVMAAPVADLGLAQKQVTNGS